MPRRRNAATDAPPCAPAHPQKKPSPFWSALKYLGGGVVLGIAGYEGLRYWKKLKGEPADPVQLNPAHQQHPGGMAPMGLMPQMMPFPLPLPYPMQVPFQQPQFAPQPPPTPAFQPVERNPELEVEHTPVRSRRNSRRRLTQEEVQQLLEAVEAEE